MARVTAPRKLGQARDYRQLILILRQRVDELRTTYEELDRVAGLPSRYTGKLLGPNGRRSLGSISLGPLLAVLGVELVVQENLDNYERIRSRLEPRRWARKNAGAGMLAIRRRWRARFRGCSEWGKLMRARQIVSTSSKQRSEIALHAANCRWQRRTPSAEAVMK